MCIEYKVTMSVSITSNLSTDEGSCCSETPTTTTIRSIHFFPKVFVALIPDRDDLTEEESFSVWYSRDDYMSMRQDVQRDVGILELFSDPCPDTDRYTSLGLKTKDEMERDAIMRRFAARTVLFEQNVQWDEHVHNPGLMADLYLDTSSYHKRIAKERAFKLASEMQHFKTTDESSSFGSGKDFKLPIMPLRRSPLQAHRRRPRADLAMRA